jgi:hypothetical protein
VAKGRLPGKSGDWIVVKCEKPGLYIGKNSFGQYRL